MDAQQMEAPVVSQPETNPSLWERLKASTRSAHEGLDSRIMQGKPFAGRENYGRFLLVQHDFHAIVSGLYNDPALAERLLPDLAERDRLALLKQDIRDLGLDVPGEASSVRPADALESIGWLYVAEGSNLGAAFLLKAAAELGLNETFGARHLAGAPEGRGRHWKTFTAALDALGLSPDEEQRIVSGANAAFNTVRSFVEARFFEGARAA